MSQDETPTPSKPAEVRKHYYLDRYTVIAPGRNKRPKQFDEEKPGARKQRKHHPIEDRPSLLEIPNEHDGWRVKVIQNDYPAFTVDNHQARGTQEVVLETNRHDITFGQLAVDDIEAIVHAYQQRLQQLSTQYNYVSIFKNHGYYSGASLNHSHSQIIATDIVPPQVAYERQVLTKYQHAHGSSPMCDVVRWELTQRKRVIAHTRYMTTICPYASIAPLEVWIVPNRQAHSLADLSTEEVHSLSDHLKGVTMALAAKDIDFNYHVYEPAPDCYNHTFIQIVPRINIWGGFELNTGMYMNTVSPEYATAWYQQHIKTPDAV